MQNDTAINAALEKVEQVFANSGTPSFTDTRADMMEIVDVVYLTLHETEDKSTYAVLMNKLRLEALLHYDLMIKWARGQNPADPSDMKVMKEQIGHNWSGTHCPYCRRCCDGCFDARCQLISYPAVSGCCDGRWSNMNNASTWEEWLTHAREVRQYIYDNGRGNSDGNVRFSVGALPEMQHAVRVSKQERRMSFGIVRS